MIEVAIWFGNEHGDGVCSYLIDIEPPNFMFHTESHSRAILRALREFEADQPKAKISRVDVRHAPSRVLQVTAPSKNESQE